MAVTTEPEARTEPAVPSRPRPDRRLTLTREQAELLQRILRLYQFGLPDLS